MFQNDSGSYCPHVQKRTFQYKSVRSFKLKKKVIQVNEKFIHFSYFCVGNACQGRKIGEVESIYNIYIKTMAVSDENLSMNSYQST